MIYIPVLPFFQANAVVIDNFNDAAQTNTRAVFIVAEARLRITPEISHFH